MARARVAYGGVPRRSGSCGGRALSCGSRSCASCLPSGEGAALRVRTTRRLPRPPRRRSLPPSRRHRRRVPEHFDPEDLLAWTKRKPVPAPAWRDATVVEQRFAEAIAAVEQECGAKFEARPTVRISTREDVKKIRGPSCSAAEGVGAGAPLPAPARRAEVSGELVKNGSRHPRGARGPRDRRGRLGAARCRPGRRGGAARRARPRVRACARLPPFPVGRLRTGSSAPPSSPPSEPSSRVTRSASRGASRPRGSFRLAFDAFTKAIDAVPDGVPEFFRPLFRGMASQATFAYRRGEAFLAAVAAEAGDAGVLRALTTPPKTTREIEHPELRHLACFGRSRPDPGALGPPGSRRRPRGSCSRWMSSRARSGLAPPRRRRTRSLRLRASGGQRPRREGARDGDVRGGLHAVLHAGRRAGPRGRRPTGQRGQGRASSRPGS